MLLRIVPKMCATSVYECFNLFIFKFEVMRLVQDGLLGSGKLYALNAKRSHWYVES